jgi:hypothetical protein
LHPEILLAVAVSAQIFVGAIKCTKRRDFRIESDEKQEDVMLILILKN